MKHWRVIAVAATIGATVASCVSYIAGQHNSQGEFSSASGDLSLLLLFKNVFIWYFLAVFSVTLLLGLAIASGTTAEDSEEEKSSDR